MALALNAWMLANISRSLWNISDKYLSKRDGRERKVKKTIVRIEGHDVELKE
jgi:hypothetical protein